MMSPIQCNGCTACCKHDIIWLEPGDDPTQYEHLRAPDGDLRRLALGVKPNGDCAYLGTTGCTIQDTKPLVCKRFDCRVYWAGMSKEQRRQRMEENPALVMVFAAGRRRQRALPTGRES